MARHHNNKLQMILDNIFKSEIDILDQIAGRFRSKRKINQWLSYNMLDVSVNVSLYLFPYFCNGMWNIYCSSLFLFEGATCALVQSLITSRIHNPRSSNAIALVHKIKKENNDESNMTDHRLQC